MIKKVDFHIPALEGMKKYPNELFYIGNLELLKRKKVSIVGSRDPSQYAREYTRVLSQELSSCGVVVVSGAAMGIDAVAHSSAGASNTIGIAGNSLDIRYPVVNSKLIQQIEQEGLMISQFPVKTTATRYTFPIRNELVVALGDVLIVAQADINSGTMRSVEYALKMGKEIFVLPHRLGESEGTTQLLARNQAKAIYDIKSFIKKIANTDTYINTNDEFLQFCQTNPTFDEANAKDANKLFEYELSGKIVVENGKVKVV